MSSLYKFAALLVVSIGASEQERLTDLGDAVALAFRYSFDIFLQVRPDPECQSCIFFHFQNLSTRHEIPVPEIWIDSRMTLCHPNVIHLSSQTNSWMTILEVFDEGEQSAFERKCEICQEELAFSN